MPSLGYSRPWNALRPMNWQKPAQSPTQKAHAVAQLYSKQDRGSLKPEIDTTIPSLCVAHVAAVGLVNVRATTQVVVYMVVSMYKEHRWHHSLPHALVTQRLFLLPSQLSIAELFSV